MSRNGYAAPLPIELRPSPGLRLLWLLLVLATAAIVLTLPFAPWVRLLLVLGVFAIGGFEYRRHFGPAAPTALLWQADGEWLLSSGQGLRRARLSGRSLSTPPLVLLNFRLLSGRGRRHLPVLLTPARCDPDTLRRLRVRLRLEYRGDNHHDG